VGSVATSLAAAQLLSKAHPGPALQMNYVLV